MAIFRAHNLNQTSTAERDSSVVVDLDHNRIELHDRYGSVEVVDASTWAHRFTHQDSPKTGLLRPALRWLSPQGNAALVERPPMECTIAVSGQRAVQARALSDHVSYDLILPWTVWLVDISPLPFLFGFARNGPLAQLSDLLGCLPLPNMGYGGGACLGIKLRDELSEVLAQPELPVTRAVDLVIDGFLSSHFNADMDFSELRLPAEVTAAIKPPADQKQWLTMWSQANLAQVLSWTWAEGNSSGVFRGGAALTVTDLLAVASPSLLGVWSTSLPGFVRRVLS